MLGLNYNVCIIIGERAERARHSGVTQLKIGNICLFIYMCVDVRMSFCTLTIAYFCVRSVFDPVPNFTKQNPPSLVIITRIALEIELFTALNCFAGAVKTKNIWELHFYSS